MKQYSPLILTEQNITHKLVTPHETLHVLHQRSLVIAIDPLLKKLFSPSACCYSHHTHTQKYGAFFLNIYYQTPIQGPN